MPDFDKMPAIYSSFSGVRYEQKTSFNFKKIFFDKISLAGGKINSSVAFKCTNAHTLGY